MKKTETRLLLFCCLSLMLMACSSDDPEIPTDSEEPDVVTIEKQKVNLNADDYKHQFIGGGVSIGLFLGHHYSMNETAQDEALQLLTKECNMKYFQDYIEIYPEDDPAYFDRRANYVKAAKEYQPNLEFSLVGNKFPRDLMREIVVDGETLLVLDTEDPAIYDRLAFWFFKLFEGFKERGVSVEILNVVNEPDLDRTFRKYHYGLDGNTKEAVARVFKYAVPKFKEMLNDPLINTLGMEIPLIMGPSTISPNGCIDYIQFFKNEHPDVWDGIDIVAMHQYENGANIQLFNSILNEAEGKPIYQSETHALKGDAVGFVTAPDPLKAALSLSNLFSTAVNNGVSSWFYFENNYPNEFHPGGLLHIPWAAQQPKPYKHYYAFRQLTSTQPESSNIITYQTRSTRESDIIAFRKSGQDTIYFNYSNYDVNPKEVSIVVNNTGKKIKGYSITTTDENDNGALIETQTFQAAKDTLTFEANRYSVNTLKITITD